MRGILDGICIAPEAGARMIRVPEIEVIAGQGLKGDRYATGNGSFNKDNPGKRQVTLMNSLFFEGSGFAFADSRRNLFVRGVELMWLIGREFEIGTVHFRGLKYCDPCERPNDLSHNKKCFRETFYDRGGLVAEVIKGGIIRVGDRVVPRPKN